MLNRRKLKFDCQHKVLDFIMKISESENKDEFVIEDYEGHLRVNARSITGVLYATKDFEDIYLRNCEHPGCFPDFIEKFLDKEG